MAASDPSGFLATPVETVQRGDGDLARIAALVAEHEAVLVYVGLPRSLAGGEGPAAAKVRAFVAQLAEQTTAPIRLVDERMSTVTAETMLKAPGKRGRNSGKKRRAVVDQVAAVVILQAALDTERAANIPAGELVVRHDSADPSEGAAE